MAAAQRLLAVPNLSALTVGQAGYVSVNSRSGFIYASFNGDRAMGVASSGLARVAPSGVIDAYWHPTGLNLPQQHLVAHNGDVFVVNQSGPTGVEILRYSGVRGGVPLNRYPITTQTRSTTLATRIAAGQDQWLYFATYEVADATNLSRIQVNRIDTRTGEVDSQWAYTEQTGAFADVKVGIDGAVYLVGPNLVARLSTGSSAAMLWSQNFPLAVAVVATAPDARAGLFIAICQGSCADLAIVLKLDASGVVDRAWDATAASDAMSQSAHNRSIAVLGDSVFVATSIDHSSTRSTASVTRFDMSGVEKARWSSTESAPVREILGGAGDKLFVDVGVSALDNVRALNRQTLVEERSLQLTFGRGGSISRVLPLPAGGYLLFGAFDVWQDGRRYRDLVRVRADGLLDAAWMAKLAPGEYFNAEITSRGLAMSGAFISPSGERSVALKLVSLATDEVVDPTWAADLPPLWTVASYSGDYFYALDSGGTTAVIRRASVVTGVIDAAWTVSIGARFGEQPFAVKADKAGGLWLFWQSSGNPASSLTTTIERYGVADRLVTQSFAETGSQRLGAALQSTPEHAYIGTRRYDLNRLGALDATWDLTRSVLATAAIAPVISGRYLYYVTPQGLRRALLTGDGTADASWLINPPVLPAGSSGWDALVIAKVQNAAIAPIEGDDIDYVLNFNAQGVPAGSTFATSRTTLASDKTVVEYFNRDVGRYFMSGRASEQATLDGLPASFQRTGMTFSAKSSEYRDVPEQPVCRFYAAPESGGSNTHFYGTGEDCPALNTVREVRFEGFDFAVIRPSNATCPSSAPNLVYRLFNNKSATNQGNHRYVVSAATKSRMVAQGWVDEGAVFCATSVVDAAN
ncbi:MAG: hypothetical protein H7203_14585 [Rhizobacter sp.]|nr:hypothetical protein [Burkholderiales bacterium]